MSCRCASFNDRSVTPDRSQPSFHHFLINAGWVAGKILQNQTGCGGPFVTLATARCSKKPSMKSTIHWRHKAPTTSKVSWRLHVDDPNETESNSTEKWLLTPPNTSQVHCEATAPWCSLGHHLQLPYPNRPLLLETDCHPAPLRHQAGSLSWLPSAGHCTCSPAGSPAPPKSASCTCCWGSATGSFPHFGPSTQASAW